MKLNKNLVFAICITFIYAVITLICVLHHETWADEAQVWQLCKYLNIPELYNHLHNEGHPILFYLMVMPFAKIFPDIIYMQMICWAFMCFAVFMLFYYSPFKLITKFAIMLSGGFLYYFPVIARSYSIIPFLVFLAAIFYNKQKEHPFIYILTLSLIAMTHAIMLCFSVFLFVLFIYDNILKNKDNSKKFILACSIFLISIIYVFLQLHDTTSSNACIKLDFSDLFIKTFKIISFFFINAYNNEFTFNKSIPYRFINIPLIIIFIASYIMCLINLYLNNKKIFWILFSSLLFQFGIYLFLYPAHTYCTRIFTAHTIMLFCFWILICNKNFNDKYKICSEKATNILITIFFSLSIFNGINYYFHDIYSNYSPAKSAYEFLKTQVKQEDLMLIDNEPFTIALIYFLDKDNLAENLYSVLRSKRVKYVIWDKIGYYVYSNEAWKDCAEYLRENGFKGDLYIIQGNDGLKNKAYLSDTYKDSFKLIYESNNNTVVRNEKYYIYKYIKD